MAEKIYVLQFVHTEWDGTRKLYERRESLCAFRSIRDAYDAAEFEAIHIMDAYKERGFDLDDSRTSIGLVRYKNDEIDGTWNFYIDELPID